jgi:SAM-dependent methyltransferase
MSNPWLNIPLGEYEGHMKSAEVQQLDVLSELFAEALACCRPTSVAVLGVAGGNGLEHVESHAITRIVGLDVNPLYLDEVRRRHADKRGLELHCVDLAEQVVDLEPVQMVHAALVFEHAGVDRCLENAISLVAPGGALCVVLQLPGEFDQGAVTSRFSSIQKLNSHFSWIDPEWLHETLAQHEFRPIHQARRSLPAGKGFWMGIFGR